MTRPPRRWPSPRGWTAVLLAVATVVAVAIGVQWVMDTLARHRNDAAGARGGALYRGQVPLPGRLLGHEADLPGIATRCVNCHEAGSAGLPTAPGGRYAVALTAAHLATPRPRRGGPASVYDAHRLCTLLRSGVDPAQVMIDSAMPRYQPTDEQCQDLWTYLLSR